MTDQPDWQLIADQVKQAGLLAERYNLCIWDAFAPEGKRWVEAYRMKDGNKQILATADSLEEMIQKIVDMGQEGELEEDTVTDIDPEIWKLHVDSAAFDILHKIQDLHQTFAHLIGPLGLVHDKYCVIDAKLRNLSLETRTLTNAIRRVKVKEKEPDG